jgi:hypothetical protein
MYKVWWILKFRHTDDGYFYKFMEFHKGHKYVQDYFDAKELLSKVNDAIMMLGLGTISETGMEKEEDDGN